jgi:hypothetical protein
MATRIAHIWWLPHPQFQHTAATKRVQFLPTHHLVQVSELTLIFNTSTPIYVT